MASTVRTFVNTFNSKIEEPVRLHLKNVYACLTMSMLSAAAGAYCDIYTNLFANLHFFTLFGALGCLIGLYMTKDSHKNLYLRIGLLLGLSFFTGLGLGPLLEHAIEINPNIVPTAFISTALIFVSFSISALLAKRASWLFLGGIISSVCLMLFFTTLISIFLRTTIFLQVHLYVGLFLMCAFVLYDTQLIMEKRRLGDKDFISHSVDLFIDFIGIFKRLLIILSEMESNKRDNRKRN